MIILHNKFTTGHPVKCYIILAISCIIHTFEATISGLSRSADAFREAVLMSIRSCAILQDAVSFLPEVFEMGRGQPCHFLELV
jgi:hypothetical protein